MVAPRFWRIALVLSLVGLLVLLTSLKGTSALDSTLDSLSSYVPHKAQPAPETPPTPDTPKTDEDKAKDKEVAKDWPFPKKIWQTDKSLKKDGQKLKLIDSWFEKNPTFRYELLNDYGAEDYVRREFANLPKLRDAYLNTPDVILRADMLRILLMYGSGGVYSDTDTECLLPIHEWVPKEYWGKANLVVGFETERSRDEGITQEAKDEVKVCQWTLLSMPKSKHVLGIMDHIVDNMHAMADKKGVKFEELGKNLDIPEVIWATGPAEVTVALQASLSKSLGQTIDRRNMSGHLEPFLLDDVLFLPVNAFAGHQGHSHSGEKEMGPLMVKHYYGSSWWKAHGNDEKEKEKEKTT
jgi:mannosyltransferase OCH1-like enzyme